MIAVFLFCFLCSLIRVVIRKHALNLVPVYIALVHLFYYCFRAHSYSCQTILLFSTLMRLVPSCARAVKYISEIPRIMSSNSLAKYVLWVLGRTHTKTHRCVDGRDVKTRILPPLARSQTYAFAVDCRCGVVTRSKNNAFTRALITSCFRKIYAVPSSNRTRQIQREFSIRIQQKVSRSACESATSASFLLSDSV